MKFTLSDKITLLNETALESLNEVTEKAIIKRFTETGLKIIGGDFGCAWFRDNYQTNFELAYKSPEDALYPGNPAPETRNKLPRREIKKIRC